MNATELDEVEALLDRVLPDPRGFAERLFQQVLTRLAGVAESAPTIDGESLTITDPETVDSESDPQELLPYADLVLAAALGACDCWGSLPECAVCQGEGSSGWTQPDPELFREYVRPALERLTAATAFHADQRVDGAPDQADETERPTQGDNA